MSPVERPVQLAPPPPGLGRLGTALHWLAEAQGAWPPHAPRRAELLAVDSGRGYDAGREEADALADAGVDLLAVEASGDPVPALLAIGALLDLEPVMLVGTSAEPGWMELVVRVRDGLTQARSQASAPGRLLSEPALGRLTGLLAQSAIRRTPVLLGSSVVVAAAAQVAERMEPGARRWWLVASAPTAPAARLAFAELALEPVLDLGLTGAGGAMLALDLLTRGVELAGA